MKSLITIIAALLVSLIASAEPSDNHVALQKTASWAVAQPNVELLRALLQAGVQIDEPVEPDMGLTLLHLAAMYNRPMALQFLLDNGALKQMRAETGDRPIDLAFSEGQTNVCQLLAKQAEKERMVGEFPKAVLDEILRFEYSEEPTFVSINGTNAPPVIAKWLGRIWKDVRPASQAELSKGTQKKTGHIQDIETKEPGRRFDIMIKKTKDGYDWTVRSYHGPLAGYGQSGKLIKRYGYWIRTGVEGWDS